jgi:uncharacterized membrane protein YkoI
MMKRSLHTLRALLLVPLFAVAMPYCTFADDAEDRRDHELARQALVEGRIKSLADITAIFQNQMPGEIVGVEIERENKTGAFVYEFKVLTPGGQLKEVDVDATNGTILKTEDDD